MSTSYTRNPATASKWYNDVQKILGTPDPRTLALGDMLHWESGSKLTMKHYLHLKTLWVDLQATEFRLQDFVSESVMETSRKYSKTRLLKEFFQSVRYSIPANKPHSEKSIFSLVKFYLELVEGFDSRTLQAEEPDNRRVLRPRKERFEREHSSLYEEHDAGSPSLKHRSKGKGRTTEMLSSPLQFATPMPAGDEPAPRQEFLDTQDESIVNMQLLLLLNALTERIPEFRVSGCDWTPEHASFQINDNRDSSIFDEKKEKILKALVDGHLLHASGLSAALVEVKPYLRQAGLQRIQWQETAQMCASICELLRMGVASSGFGLLQSQDPEIKRRLMIAQDHNEVYINIAEYDMSYEHFLEGITLPISRPKTALTSKVRLGVQHPTRSSRPITPPSQTPAAPQSPPGSASSSRPRQAPPVNTLKPSALKRIVKSMTPKKSTSGKEEKLKEAISVAPAEGPPRPRDTAGFLVMRSFGPWTMTQPDDVGNLCQVLIALSLHLSQFMFEDDLARRLAALRI